MAEEALLCDWIGLFIVAPPLPQPAMAIAKIEITGRDRNPFFTGFSPWGMR
jgi:hypothetical protein